MNINSGAAGNPLDALLGGRSLFGKAGGMLYPDAQTLTNGSPDSSFIWNDPRYFEQYITPGSEGGGGETRYRLNQATQNALNGRVQLRNTNIGGPGEAIDPSQVTYDPQFGLLTNGSNVTPSDTRGDWLPWALAAIPAVGMAYGAMTGGGLGGAAGNESAGLSMANPFGGAAASSGLPNSYWGTNVANGTTVGSEAPNWAAQGAGAGGLDPETLSGAGGMSVGQNGIGPGSLMSQLSGAINNPSSLLSGNGMLANGAQGLLSSALHSPLQALGAAQMLGGLIHPGNGGGSRSSASSKPQGGSGVPQPGTYQRPQWTPNPYTAMQLNQLYGSTLGGH